MPLIALADVTLGFRGPPVLEQANMTIEPGERVCLLGRNGTGKTTLLRLLHGKLEPDRGEVVRQQGLRTAMLPQEVPRDLQGSVFDEVARGLGPKAELLAEYHRLAGRLAIEGSARVHAELGRIQHAVEIDGGWRLHQEVQAVLSRVSLQPDAEVATLSAGLKRRALLAKAVAGKPDVLLLDEPTNHLDIDSIGWLEEFLLRCGGSLLFVTHDRALLRKVATRILELDRGRLTSWSCDYQTYLNRKEAGLQAEARQNAEFDKKLAREEVWIRTGIQARRTRNEGRVRALEALRQIRRARRERPGDVKMEIQEADRSGRLVIQTKHLQLQLRPADHRRRSVYDDHARRPGGSNRPQRLGQDDPPAPAAGRLATGGRVRFATARTWRSPTSTSSMHNWTTRSRCGRTSATGPTR